MVKGISYAIKFTCDVVVFRGRSFNADVVTFSALLIISATLFALLFFSDMLDRHSDLLTQ